MCSSTVFLRRNQTRITLDMISPAKVSLVTGSNQTNSPSPTKKTAMQHNTENEERAICQSLLCLDLVSFSVSRRMKLQVVCRCVSFSLSRSLLRCGVEWGDTLKNPHEYVQNVPVYLQHVHMYKHMWVWCRYTRERFERTHGGVEEEGHRQFCLPKFAHVRLSRASEVHQRNTWIFPIFKFENRSSTTSSRFLQFASPEHTIQLQTRDTPHIQTCTHTQHNAHGNTQQHSTEHATTQNTPQHRSKEKRRRDERDEEREKQRRNRVGLRVGREQHRHEAPIIRVTLACHAQPLSRPRYIYIYIYTLHIYKLHKYTCASL